MSRLRILLIPAVALILSGCSSPEESTMTPQSAAVSSIPWNKPASWEGAGALGGFMPQGGH